MINTTKLEARNTTYTTAQKDSIAPTSSKRQENSIVKLYLCSGQEIGCTIETEDKTDYNNMALRRVQEARREEKMGKKGYQFLTPKNSTKQ